MTIQGHRNHRGYHQVSRPRIRQHFLSRIQRIHVHLFTLILNGRGGGGPPPNRNSESVFYYNGVTFSLLPLLKGRSLAPVLALAPTLAFVPASAASLAPAPALAVAPLFLLLLL